LVLEGLLEVWPQVDALLVLDQVSEEECGVVTAQVREELGRLGEANPARFMLADSRERVGLFRGVSVKPNAWEAHKALLALGLMRELASAQGRITPPAADVAKLLAQHLKRPVFCTMGEAGICLAESEADIVRTTVLSAYPVTGPIDP